MICWLWIPRQHTPGPCAGLKTLRPSLQYLAGELPVAKGDTLPLRCSHNTVRLRFDLEAAEYTHMAKPDAAFPAVHFSMLADRSRNEARCHHTWQLGALLRFLGNQTGGSIPAAHFVMLADRRRTGSPPCLAGKLTLHAAEHADSDQQLCGEPLK